ncbi:MAG: hypothetical protein IT422_16975 [Pirellulaceae bacterium]|jgi:hypothetical protein|nr:hypothetical protein [Pirellulaceae bacterium]
MDDANENDIDFQGLKHFLKGIGFEEVGNPDTSLILKHQESDTIVAITVPENGHSVRPADLLSIIVRLEYQGIADEKTLEQFRAGKLPLAS